MAGASLSKMKEGKKESSIPFFGRKRGGSVTSGKKEEGEKMLKKNPANSNCPG